MAPKKLSPGGRKFNRRATVSEWLNVLKFRRKPTSVQEMLAKVPVFGKLKEKELRHIGAIVHHRHYMAGEQVFLQDDPGLGMYIVRQGEVSVVFSSTDGEKKDLATLKEGDFFGELALLDESPRSASVVAKTECDLIGFFRPDLFRIIEKSPTVGIKVVIALAEMIGERLRNTNEELSRLQSKLNQGRLR